jgi:glucose-6-phosphate isomerase/transaldolase/glucose-6-phosphate isomerase
MELLERLLKYDSTLWPEPNVSLNRLGWIPVIDEMIDQIDDLIEFEKSIDFSKIVLLGMGGSSLAPLVFYRSMVDNGIEPKRKLTVCDTTHPKTVGEVDFKDAVVIVSSKSGTTLEPNVLFDYAYSKINDPKRFIAITDPETALENLAVEKGFLKIFTNRSDIGGRYSALSYFGLIPALLVGYDLSKLLHSAKGINKNDAIVFGQTFATAAKEGRDKLTIKVPKNFESLGLWLEQLIAESTGKSNRGVVPVPTLKDEFGNDRHNVSIDIENIYDLSGIFFSWELSTAIAGHILEIDPFNEPNVAESKANTNKVLETLPIESPNSTPPAEVIMYLRDNVKEDDYISIQAYLPYGNDDKLLGLRDLLSGMFETNAVTWGYGPRFLHSTGQLHKGGANNVVVLQIVDSTSYDSLSIPSKPYDFNTLIAAQSIGDYQSLLKHDRRVVRVALKDLSEIS